MGEKNIIVSVICYNNEKEVVGFARQMVSQEGLSLKLLITCNATKSKEAFLEDLNGIGKDIQVFFPEENLGYLKGCLYGIEQYGKPYDWALISNTDLTIEKDFIYEIFKDDVGKDVWGIGPNIILASNGRQQNPLSINRPSTKKIKFLSTIYKSYWMFCLYSRLAKIKQNIFNKRTSIIDPRCVYAIHGSCFFLRRDCVEQIIREKSPIFMYDEEFLIAELARENDKNMYYLPTASVIHNENQSTKTVESRRKHIWYRDSTNYIWERFFKRSKR